MNSYLEGKVILIDKPYRWTSFQAVNKVKWIIKQKALSTKHKVQSNDDSLLKTQDSGLKTKLKVGHAGTLDPLATGLLIICTGKFTKRIEEFQAMEKEYTGTFFLGATTPCFDLEKEVDQHFPTEHITEKLIIEATEKFKGKIMQVPPIFSAVKVSGERAYDIARRGHQAEIKPREISVTEFEITRIALPEVDFRVVCSKGTYIRSLARDFGLELGSGAHLTALCRTRIGNFRLEDALSPEEFEKQINA